MPPSPCLGCGQLTNGSRCRNCQRPNSRQRGYDHHWEHTRAAFLAACPTCERCADKATEAHHIDGLGPRGPRGFDWENLEALCKPCHSRHTATQHARHRL